jgi:glycosyltransferase involved in cell wall biosynthesis
MRERPRPREGTVVVGFVGTLDRRIDMEIIRAVATAEPSWLIRLIGPVAEGFDQRLLADLRNVRIEPQIPYERLGEVLADFDLGLMPYFDHPMYRGMSPIKNLELLAAGVPAVARPAPALEPYRDIVRMADSPAEFVAQLREALASDTSQEASRRRTRAEEQTWDRVHAELIALVSELQARNRPLATMR